MDKAILQQWLKAGFMEHGTLHPTEAGTPQGGIASPVLAHLALDGLEGELRTPFPTRHHRLSREKTRITHIAEGFDFLGQHIRK
jgi:RNA-directed DNA polymerase